MGSGPGSAGYASVSGGVPARASRAAAPARNPAERKSGASPARPHRSASAGAGAKNETLDDRAYSQAASKTIGVTSAESGASHRESTAGRPRRSLGTASGSETSTVVTARPIRLPASRTASEKRRDAGSDHSRAALLAPGLRMSKRRAKFSGENVMRTRATAPAPGRARASNPG